MPTKTELLAELDAHYKRLAFRCIHGHTGYSHRNCWKKAMGVKDKIGFFDIETSDLLADWGFVLCWCIKHEDGKIIESCITPEEVLSHKLRDHRVIKEFAEAVKQFDTLAVYYG